MYVEYPSYIPADDIRYMSVHLSPENLKEAAACDCEPSELIQSCADSSIFLYIIRDSGTGWPKAVGGTTEDGHCWTCLSAHTRKDRILMLRHAKDILCRLEEAVIKGGGLHIGHLQAYPLEANTPAVRWYEYLGFERYGDFLDEGYVLFTKPLPRAPQED